MYRLHYSTSKTKTKVIAGYFRHSFQNRCNRELLFRLVKRLVYPGHFFRRIQKENRVLIFVALLKELLEPLNVLK